MGAREERAASVGGRREVSASFGTKGGGDGGEGVCEGWVNRVGFGLRGSFLKQVG